MKLSQFLQMKRWNAAIFAREFNIDYILIMKIIKQRGGISLDLALYIEKVSEGAVTPWDLSLNADAIKYGKWNELKENSKRKNRHKKRKEDQESNPIHIETEEKTQEIQHVCTMTGS